MQQYFHHLVACLEPTEKVHKNPRMEQGYIVPLVARQTELIITVKSISK